METNKEKRYSIGKGLSQWKDGNAQTITFIVTEDCNLRCKYCYITHKSAHKRMNFEVAKKFIDYIFTNHMKRQDAVIIEFIGGEPFLEIELIDKISDYFKLKSFEKDDKWYWNYRFNVCTNGINYSSYNVQKWILKNSGKVSVSITIDGTKEKHDMQRVFPDGTGSYDIIMKAIPMYIHQTLPTTKVTFSSDDLKFLKESIITLYKMGIVEIAANVVYEDVWKEGDDKIFEDQMIELAKYILENNLYNSFKCSLFDESIGGYYTKGEKLKTHCGAGKMIAIGPEGKLYPCLRYKDYSLNNKVEWSIGDINEGINMNFVRPFMTAMNALQSDQECLNCEVARGCGHCQGFNYDVAETNTNFNRAKFICKMHKARVRANDYYFSRLFNEYGIERENKSKTNKKLYFLLNDDYVDFCTQSNKCDINNPMDESIITKGLDFARENFFDIYFIHSKEKYDFKNIDQYKEYTITHVIPFKYYFLTKDLNKVIYVINKKDDLSNIECLNKVIVNVNQNNISDLSDYITSLYEKVDFIYLNIQHLDENFDFQLYKDQLMEIKKYLKKNSNKKKLNLFNFSNEVDNETQGCDAGFRTFALAPNGNLYICPHYYINKYDSVGDIYSGLYDIKGKHLYTQEYKPICQYCELTRCCDCVYLNEIVTKEVNVQPSFFCKKKNIEKVVFDREFFKFEDIEKELDPIYNLLENNNEVTGYYKP